MSGIAVLRSLGGADGARLPFLGKVTSGEDAGLRRRDRLTRLALAGAFKGRPTWPHWERARLRPRGDRIRAGGQKAAIAGIICATSPTLAESYKVAALDATNKMRQVERFSP